MGVNMRHVVNQLKCVEIKGWIPKTPKLLSKVGVVTSKESWLLKWNLNGLKHNQIDWFL